MPPCRSPTTSTTLRPLSTEDETSEIEEARAKTDQARAERDAEATRQAEARARREQEARDRAASETGRGQTGHARPTQTTTFADFVPLILGIVLSVAAVAALIWLLVL
jgi:sRNA-binding protein